MASGISRKHHLQTDWRITPEPAAVADLAADSAARERARVAKAVAPKPGTPGSEAEDVPVGDLAIVLHSHMPYVEGFGTYPFGEEWRFDAFARSLSSSSC